LLHSTAVAICPNQSRYDSRPTRLGRTFFATDFKQVLTAVLSASYRFTLHSEIARRPAGRSKIERLTYEVWRHVLTICPRLCLVSDRAME
jgi:hypothetical protein